MTTASHNILRAAPALLALLLCQPAAARTLQEITESYPLETGGSISLDNINGDIELKSWDESRVQVNYRITGKSEKALERIRVKIKADPNHLRIDTIHSKSNSWWGSGDGGSVSYELMVPTGARLRSIETVNGSISIEGVTGEVDAETVNGSIEVSGIESDAKLSTVNGRVEAQLDRLNSDQRVSLESVNGQIIVYMPDNADVEIRAETVHGQLRNDFNLPVEKGMVGKDLRGRLGSGGGRLTLDTVNGSINIRRN
ncbi:MAG: DUF4097 family beta strand repeat-containing protein [Pseudomonadota bacterium]